MSDRAAVVGIVALLVGGVIGGTCGVVTSYWINTDWRPFSLATKAPSPPGPGKWFIDDDGKAHRINP
jgi:hypothetical protein